MVEDPKVTEIKEVAVPKEESVVEDPKPVEIKKEDLSKKIDMQKLID